MALVHGKLVSGLDEWRWAAALKRLLTALFVLCTLPASGQYTAPYVVLSGVLTGAGGTPAKNATLTLEPSQVFFVGGTQVVVSEAQCSTDLNGNVVGLPNPFSNPCVSVQTGTGTVPAGNYYVKFAWYDQFGRISLPSAEVAAQLTNVGEIQVLPPVGTGPPNAVGMYVYIGATPGSETFQGQTTGTTAQYTQAAAITTSGATPSIRNTSSCRVVANDAGWPTGTGYFASLVDASGNTLFNYPEMWQFLGPGSSFNLSQGLPYYHGQVTYPVPILTVPYNHNPQSISGPLSLSGYNLYNVAALGVGTALPAWGVDVEGTGLLSIVNAAGGYLVNGIAPATGQCAISTDGVAIDGYGSCGASFEINGVAESTINMTGNLTLSCADTSGSGTAQSCSTTPTFTPAAPNTITYTTTTPNSGSSLTINVNGSGAKSVEKWGGSGVGWTTALVAGDLAAGHPYQLSFDGTDWDLQGAAPSAVGDNLPFFSTACDGVVESDQTGVSMQLLGTYLSAGALCSDLVAPAQPGYLLFPGSPSTTYTVSNFTVQGVAVGLGGAGLDDFVFTDLTNACGTPPMVSYTTTGGATAGSPLVDSVDSCTVHGGDSVAVVLSTAVSDTLSGIQVSFTY